MLSKLPGMSPHPQAHMDKPDNLTLYECGQLEQTRERPCVQNTMQVREASLRLYKRVIECFEDGDEWSDLMQSLSQPYQQPRAVCFSMYDDLW